MPSTADLSVPRRRRISVVSCAPSHGRSASPQSCRCTRTPRFPIKWWNRAQLALWLRGECGGCFILQAVVRTAKWCACAGSQNRGFRKASGCQPPLYEQTRCKDAVLRRLSSQTVAAADLPRNDVRWTVPLYYAWCVQHRCSTMRSGCRLTGEAEPRCGYSVLRVA